MILENGHIKINKVHQGDCLELMRHIPDKSIGWFENRAKNDTPLVEWQEKKKNIKDYLL